MPSCFALIIQLTLPPTDDADELERQEMRRAEECEAAELNALLPVNWKSLGIPSRGSPPSVRLRRLVEDRTGRKRLPGRRRPFGGGRLSHVRGHIARVGQSLGQFGRDVMHYGVDMLRGYRQGNNGGDGLLAPLLPGVGQRPGGGTGAKRGAVGAGARLPAVPAGR
jgi:hypothetical protein